MVLMQGIAPGRQVVPASAAGAFRVRGDDRHARFDQIVPVMDLFRVALTDEEHDGGSIGRGVIRQALQPVFIDTTALSDRVDVVGQRQRNHIRFNTVNHRSRLLAGAAVRLADHHVVAGLLLPVRAERFVVLFVQLARWIIRYV